MEEGGENVKGRSRDREIWFLSYVSGLLLKICSVPVSTAATVPTVCHIDKGVVCL